jgi:NTE family protein
MADDGKTVGLGLQGGGSHAAFTWGVLDRLLDEVQKGSLVIPAISGTSGGALNGAVCAYGLIDGPDEAKRLLKKLWDAVSAESVWPLDPYRLLFPKDSAERWNVDWSPLAIGIGMAEQIWSPYWNPWSSNVIGRVIEDIIPDFSKFHAKSGAPKIFVCATDVNKTKLRIFGPREISARALMASTCYPTIYQAVEIDGSYYWDGGYMGNPALDPLVTRVDDILTVLIDPLEVEDGPPMTPRQIVNRINEVSFSASWVLEMCQIELINQLLDDGLLQEGKYRKKRFHLIRNDRFMEQIGAASKQNPSRDFIYELHDVGWQAADAWLAENFAKVGIESTCRIEEDVKQRLKPSYTADPGASR